METAVLHAGLDEPISLDTESPGWSASYRQALSRGS